MIKKYISLIVWGVTPFVAAQEKKIDTVFISDKKLNESVHFQKVINLSDNIHKNTSNLSETLRFSTPLYIKENGKGMVSSPSFRGTTAQQTAFIWNGININSLFLGQGDINNIGLLNFDKISVKAGGGSISYGTGAIGGTIHLDDKIQFGKGLNGNLFSEFGSFNTLNSALKIAYSNDKFSVKLNTALAKSENNYEVPKEKYINRNGAYYQYNYSISAAYRFNDHQKIAMFSLWNTGLQHYPIFSESQTKTKYSTDGLKTMINWQSDYGNFHNDLKLAFLSEKYDYYSDINLPKSNGAEGKTWLVRNDFSYQKPNNFSINLISEYQYNSAEGYSSGITTPKRNTGYLTITANKNLFSRLYLEGSLRKDLVENIESPYLFFVGSRIDFTKNYSLKLNASKNFRYPTFNDLYWQPGGNLNLKPETAYQFEINHLFKFKNLNIDIASFYNDIENLIQWLPTSSGYWSPFNSKKIRSFGGEIYANYTHNIGKNTLKISLSYAYTNSKDTEKNKSLSYVPKHKANGIISLKNKYLSLFIQGIFTSEVFTTTDENKNYQLPHYTIVNAGVEFYLKKNITLGGKINNILNQVYKTSNYYPLPLRNYNINFNINF